MCIASYAGTNRYQVSCPFGEQFVVDMAGKTCSCHKWQLRGIPCGHAVACINRRHEQPEQHVSHTYLKTTYVCPKMSHPINQLVLKDNQLLKMPENAHFVVNMATVKTIANIDSGHLETCLI